MIFLARFLKALKLCLILVLKNNIRTDGGVIRLNGPKRFRIFLEEMGGAFVKFGQILDLYQDAMPYPYVQELLKVKNRGREIPFLEMKRIFTEETGLKIESFFSDFDPRPVASTVSAQIYKAILRDGSAVSVKIQRPYIDIIFKADFIAISIFLGLAGFFGLISSRRAQEIFQNFASWTRKSLDYLIEAKNAEILYKHQEAHPETVIPKQYLELTTHKVLIQEFIEKGFKVRDLEDNAPREEIGTIDREKVMSFIVGDEMRQYFIDGFFHVDPNPSNLFFVSENKLVHLDFWIIGSAEQDRVNLLRALCALSQRDIGSISKNLFDAGKNILEKDLSSYLKMDLMRRKQFEAVFLKIEEILEEGFRKDLEKILLPWFISLEDKNSTIEEKRIAPIFLKIINKADEYDIRFSRETILFLRALIVLDTMGLQISPDFDFLGALKKFFANCPLEKAEELIREGEHIGQSGEKLIPSADISWEFFRESIASERERMMAARERIFDMITYYGEKFEEIGSMLKTIK